MLTWHSVHQTGDQDSLSLPSSSPVTMLSLSGTVSTRLVTETVYLYHHHQLPPGYAYLARCPPDWWLGLSISTIIITCHRAKLTWHSVHQTGDRDAGLLHVPVQNLQNIVRDTWQTWQDLDVDQVLRTCLLVVPTHAEVHHRVCVVCVHNLVATWARQRVNWLRQVLFWDVFHFHALLRSRGLFNR